MRRPLAIVCALAFVAGLACDSGDDDGGDGGTDRTGTILATDGDAAAGEAEFVNTCGIATCHGPDGSGADNPDAPPLTMEVPPLSDEDLVNVMLEGVPPKMTPHDHLSDKQLADILAYVTESFG